MREIVLDITGMVCGMTIIPDFDVPAVAIQGNLSDGFRIFGPFDTMDDASEWSDNQPSPMLFGIGDWWIATLEPTK